MRCLSYGIAITALLATGRCYTVMQNYDVQTPMHAADKKVPVLLGVMSACPDALLCESVFDRVLKRVGSKVDISLTFIGT